MFLSFFDLLSKPLRISSLGRSHIYPSPSPSFKGVYPKTFKRQILFGGHPFFI